MAEAKRQGGLYYVRGQAVDSEGQPIAGAPKQPKDTPPEKQPGAGGPIATDPFQRLADTIVGALGGKTAAPAKSAPVVEEDEDELPNVTDLDEHLATLTTVEDVKALQKRDDRVTAEPKYEKRIAELEAE